MFINKSDSLINLNLNISARSLKGILLIFEDLTAGGLPYARDLETGFYNPKITNVSIIIEGISNQFYASGMKSFHMWDECKRMFSSSPSKRDPDVAQSEMQLALADVTLPSFLIGKFALWLDMRTIPDPNLHGTGRKVGENGSDGVVIAINKTSEAAKALNLYMLLIMDA